MADNNYHIEDVSLATKGRFKIEWAEQEMLILRLEHIGAIGWQM